MIPMNEYTQKRSIIKNVMKRDATKMAQTPNAARIAGGFKPAPMATPANKPSKSAILGMMHRGR